MKKEIINILFRVLMCGLLGYLLGTTIRKHNEKEVSQPQNDIVMVEFNSQICTSREQSERLLALGLKKETADMCWALETTYDGEDLEWFCHIGTFTKEDADIAFYDYLPAWSLHRLLSLLPDYIVVNSSSGLNPNFYLNIRDGFVSYKDNRGFSYGSTSGNMYDAITSMISFLIKEGYFPKEYLV